MTVVNDALRAGIANDRIAKTAKSYRLTPDSMGDVVGPHDLDKALQLAGRLEDEEPVGPGDGHWPILRNLLRWSGTAGNLTSDAHIAALALERTLGFLAEAGVRIGLASGSGFPGTFEGFSEYREAVLMNRAGMPAADVIKAFSEGSATALGVSDERGMLRPGHTADLVILNANPLDNIHNLRELHAVFVHGRLARL